MAREQIVMGQFLKQAIYSTFLRMDLAVEHRTGNATKVFRHTYIQQRAAIIDLLEYPLHNIS